ncbi:MULTISPECIES: alpha/beta hydrolase family protein [unclassified Rhodanobacter]|uniref:alpha/beta hydrolase family protein n=1 Tax=unclassified Rhodanobacter TaxID=2621553 RepID=UPI001F44CBFB|nr:MULTISPECIES: alpha/beta fold hydrolase [unclassified Rhodanobacter]
MELRRWTVAALLLLFAAVLHAQPVSIADLARRAQYQDVKISPDGQYLAATTIVKGQTVLALIRLSDRKGNLVRPREEDDVTGFWWASPKRVLYSVATRLGGYDAPIPTGELFAVNADGSSPNMLYGYRKTGMSTGTLIPHATAERGNARFIAAIPDDPLHVLVAVSLWDATGLELELPVAYRMDVRTGDKIRMLAAPMRGASFVADHQGRIRFAYGTANDGSFKVYQHPVGGDGWQLLPEMGNNRSTPLAFTRDDAAVYVTCPASGGGFGVCRWDPASGALETAWSHPQVEADELLQGLARDSIAGVAFTDGRPGMALFDSESADAQVLISLMKQFPGEQVTFVSGTDDGRLSVMLVEADADPGTFYLFDRKTGKPSLLFSRMPWIDPERMARKQPFDFAARDGVKLHGYVSFPPDHEDAKHLPMVVMVHGGPYAERDRWDYESDVQLLATRGYAVLQVNFRGSGGYGYDFGRSGWGEWGGKMQDDVTDATHWAIAQGIADPRRICIYGGSYGGYAALEGAVKEPDLYQCAIGYAGIYDLPLMHGSGDIPQSSYGASYLKRVLGEDMTALAQRSPINQLDRLKARVMLVVGDGDRRVPSVQGRNLRAALQKRRVAHAWLDKSGEMHGFYSEANLTELYTMLLQFVDASIGPGAAATGTVAADGASSAH